MPFKRMTLWKILSLMIDGLIIYLLAIFVVEITTNRASQKSELNLIITLILFLLFNFSIARFWVKYESRHADRLTFKQIFKQSLQKYPKVLEFFSIILIFVLFFHQFLIKEPKDDRVNNQTLVALSSILLELEKIPGKISVELIESNQKLVSIIDRDQKVVPLAAQNLSTMALNDDSQNQQLDPSAPREDDQKSASTLISNIEFLAESNRIEGLSLAGLDLTGINLERANLRHTYFTDSTLTGANLTGADLTDAILTRADLTGVEGLTQNMLNSAQPLPPPKTLPDGLIWPFEKNAETGKWERKPEQEQPTSDTETSETTPTR